MNRKIPILRRRRESMNPLCGQTVVITGGASGIGWAFAQDCLKNDMIVWILDRDQRALEEAKNYARRYKYRLHTQAIDLMGLSSADYEKIIENISNELKSKRILPEIQKPGIDLWVNNAGISGISPLEELEDETLEAVIQLNLLSTMHGTKAALKHMEARGHGTILNMASISGHVPGPFMSAYSASKHGVIGFTESLRAELRLQESPVHLILASPGFVDTAIINKGAQFGFPPWLNWALAKPESVANEMMDAVKRKKDRVYPSWNGKVMYRMHRLFPKSTVKSAKLLLAQSVKDVVLNRYQF